MAKEESLTPEEHLLRLIEDPKTKTTDVKGALHQLRISLRSCYSWCGGWVEWFQRVRPHQIDIKFINKILGLFTFILVIYFTQVFFISIISLKKIPDLEFKIQEGAKTVSSQEARVSAATINGIRREKPASYYLEKIRERDIFKMDKKKADAALGNGFSEGRFSLKLVGICWSDNPDAMFEDSKAARTFFVKRDQIINEFKIQAIFKDKVILSYAGEEIELRLR